jgi:hypothetical protein
VEARYGDMFRGWLVASIVWMVAVGTLTVPPVYEEWIDKSDETYKVAFYGVTTSQAFERELFYFFGPPLAILGAWFAVVWIVRGFHNGQRDRP